MQSSAWSKLAMGPHGTWGMQGQGLGYAGLVDPRLSFGANNSHSLASLQAQQQQQQQQQAALLGAGGLNPQLAQLLRQNQQSHAGEGFNSIPELIQRVNNFLLMLSLCENSSNDNFSNPWLELLIIAFL